MCWELPSKFILMDMHFFNVDISLNMDISRNMDISLIICQYGQFSISIDEIYSAKTQESMYI